MSTIKIKRSSVSGKIPAASDIDYGELALNYADGILYYKNSLNSIEKIGAVIGQIDGGTPFSTYGGVPPIDGGGI